MGYSKDIYDLAMASLSERRSAALREAQYRREIISRQLPRAIAIEKEISKAGFQTARIIVTGGVDVKEQVEKLAAHNLALQKEFAELLASAGYPADYMEPHYVCEKCKDEGFIDGIMCSCLRERMEQEACQKLNRLSAMELCSFSNFKLDYYSTEEDAMGGIPRRRMEAILRFCEDYAKHFGSFSPNILMTGATGLGKTHLSLSIAREVTAKGYGVVYGSAQNFMTQLEKEKFGRAEEEEDSTKQLLECDLLILDDLGTEFITPFVSSAIYNILNTRLMTDKSTIISTNLSISEMESKYTERIVSRIIGGYRVLKFMGKDIRQIKRMESMGRSNG